MMEPFEFSNSAVSSLNSIFATVMGIAYPLILQGIERIDSKYKSTRLVKRFAKEPTFFIYQCLLAFSIFFAICSIFFLNMFDGWPVFIMAFVSIHSLVTLLLLYQTALLIHLILSYYNPEALLKKLIVADNRDTEKDSIDEGNNAHTNLLETFDIAKYAIHEDDEELFRKTTTKVYESFHLYVMKEIQKNEVMNTGLNFTSVQVDLMKQIVHMICKAEQNFFSNDINLVFVWYPGTTYLPLSDSTRALIWSFLKQIVVAGKDEWIVNYWMYATQYYQLKLEEGKASNGRTDDSTFQYQQKIFKEFHIALGALLLHSKKYSLLNGILFTSNTYPPTYSLIDNTFSSIVNDIFYFNEILSANHSIGYRYLMPKMIQDVSIDDKVVGCIYDYLAILIFRLGRMDYNVVYCDPFQLPEISHSKNTNQLEADLDVVQFFIEKFKNQNFINHLEQLDFYSSKEMSQIIEKSKNVLNQLMNAITAEREEIYKKLKIAKDKQNDVKNNLIKEDKNQPSLVPRKSDSILKDCDAKKTAYYCKVNYNVPDDVLAERIPRIHINMEEYLIHQLVSQERNTYDLFFILNQPVKFYTVRFKDVFKALEKMHIDSSYVILAKQIRLNHYVDSYGEYAGFISNEYGTSFKDAKILSIPSSEPGLIIMKHDSLPYIEYVDYNFKSGNPISRVSEETKLYSNVDNLSDQVKVLQLVRQINFVCHKGKTDFILLNVKYNTDSTDYDINRIESVKTICHNCKQ